MDKGGEMKNDTEEYCNECLHPHVNERLRSRIKELEAEVAMYKEDARILKAQRIHDMKAIAALQPPSSAKDTPDMREISAASDKFAKGNHDKSEGFDRGAQWILSKLQSSPVSVDINRELLEALVEIYERTIDPVTHDIAKAALSKASPPKQNEK
jgi:hypothetical protein